MISADLRHAVRQRAAKKSSLAKARKGIKRFLRKPPRQLEPKQIVKAYRSTLAIRQETLQALVESTIIQNLAQVIASYSQALPTRNDALADDVFVFINGIKIQFQRVWPDSRTREAARNAGDETQSWNKKELNRTTKSVLGVDIFTQEPWMVEQMSNFVEENVGLIKTVDERYFGEIQEVVFRGARQGTSVKEIAEEIRKRGDVSTSRSELIARDQINKFNGNLSEIRQRDLGVRKYIWRTSKDERVRSEHASREGEEFFWSDPPEDGHPGEPIQCRCYAEPVLEDLADE